MIPLWLHALSILAVLAGMVCALLIIIDEWRAPQHMPVMNAVWPLTALFAGPLALMFYFSRGRDAAHGRMASRDASGGGHHDQHESSTLVAVSKACAHCGSGCALGDLVAEWLAYFFPVVAIWFGWQSIFAEKIFAVWVLDFVLAFAFGIAFQYFTIKPMRQLTPRAGLVAALKADALSLTAWQLGMYGFMGFAHFWLFPHVIGAQLEMASVEFWFMMQIAMLAGFVTSWPMNWWLIRAGIKERM
jgi:hypothetical protein